MRIGIDLGGTKTEIICLDQKNGKELYRHRVPTAKGDYDACIRTIRDLVTQAEKTLGQQGTVGVGIPGTVSQDTGLVKNANSTWLNGRPLDKDLEIALNRPVKTENDANCLAVSEATDGAGEGYHCVFAVIIGTGAGAGIAVDCKPLKGINGIAGEWGHNPLPLPSVYVPGGDAARHYDIFERAPGVKDSLAHYFTDNPATSEYPGPLCYCGRRGCLETWISGTGFKNDYNRVTGQDLSTHDIIAASRAGDALASAALDRYIDRLARGLSLVINVLDPDIVVLGGGMSNVGALYERLQTRWERYIFSDTVHTKLAQSRHGDSSGVRGAAWLWGRDHA
jgi:fructokinase